MPILTSCTSPSISRVWVGKTCTRLIGYLPLRVLVFSCPEQISRRAPQRRSEHWAVLTLPSSLFRGLWDGGPQVFFTNDEGTITKIVYYAVAVDKVEQYWQLLIMKCNHFFLATVLGCCFCSSKYYTTIHTHTHTRPLSNLSSLIKGLQWQNIEKWWKW